VGSTSNFAIPYPEATDPPNGPTQMAALAGAVDTALDAVRDVNEAQEDILDEFARTSISAAPVATAGISSYPAGVSARNVSSDATWPLNAGVVVTLNYSGGSGRGLQWFQKQGTQTDARTWSRHWIPSVPGWSLWAEISNPTTELRHTSLEVSTDVNVTGTTYAETDTLLRLTITAPPSGLATVTFGFNGLNNTVNGEMFMSVDVRRVSDSNQLIPPDDNRIAYINQQSGTAIDTAERTFLLTGMNPGVDYQIRGVYKVDAGTTGTWTRRWIACIPSS
jgi:hypothetical protein